MTGPLRVAEISGIAVAALCVERICRWRDCRPGIRVARRARRCGRREFLNDDLQDVSLSSLSLVAAPPIVLRPSVVRRFDVPSDVDDVLLAQLQAREWISFGQHADRQYRGLDSRSATVEAGSNAATRVPAMSGGSTAYNGTSRVGGHCISSSGRSGLCGGWQ